MSTRSKFWSELVSRLDPYEPGEQPKSSQLIKLNTNENPYPPSPRVAEALSREAIDRLRLYPDPVNATFRQAVCNYFGVTPAQVTVGNGSDEVLAFAFQAFFKQELPLLFPDITYGFYTVYCGLYDIDYRQLPLADDFTLRLEDYRQPNGGIIFPNPNAPTGLSQGLDAIEALLQDNRDSVVIVDEAYVDFGAESAVALVDRYPNLLVVQTLSKSRSLAGARIGFAIGHPDLIEAMERVKSCFNPYSLDRLAELAGAAAMDDVDYFNECRGKVIATREQTAEQLRGMGFDVLPSHTNFLMAKPPAAVDAEALYRSLREKNIVVRYFNKPRIAGYLRISIGTDGEMAAFVDAVRALL